MAHTPGEIANIADQIMALQDLSANSGTITKRAQGSLLWQLSHDDLTAVAVEVAKQRELRRQLAPLCGNLGAEAVQNVR